MKQLLQEDIALAERYVQFTFKKYLSTTKRSKLIKLLEYIADYVVLIIYVVNRTFKLKTGRISGNDFEFLYEYCQRKDIKKILEFGPGASTYCFLKMKDVEIFSYEYNKKWLKIAQQEFKNFPNVKIFEFKNTNKVEINLNTTFDLCFIDAPLGKPSFSRLNTCLCAAKYTNLMVLHDSRRKGEKETIKYLEALGWIPTFINTSSGLCILRKFSNPKEPK